jgi:hypothetical protein
MQPRAMMRKHGLELVTTSWACEIRQYEHSLTAAQTMEEGDGMGVSTTDARTAYQAVKGTSSSSSSDRQSAVDMQPPAAAPKVATVPPLQPLSNILPVAGLGADQQQPQIAPAASGVAGEADIDHVAEGAEGAGTGEQLGQAGLVNGSNAPSSTSSSNKRWSSPADMVAGMVSEAAAAASAAAVTPLVSAAGNLYAGLASLPIAAALGAGPRSSAPAAAAAIMSAATAALTSETPGGPSPAASSGSTSVGSRLAAGLAAAAGPAAIAAAPASGLRLAPPVQSTTGSPACPSEWFVCDDAATDTRMFVIQGSDTIDHWKLNLSFDPVPFEEPELGIKVRGLLRLLWRRR